MQCHAMLCLSDILYKSKTTETEGFVSVCDPFLKTKNKNNVSTNQKKSLCNRSIYRRKFEKNL